MYIAVIAVPKTRIRKSTDRMKRRLRTLDAHTDSAYSFTVYYVEWTLVKVACYVYLQTNLRCNSTRNAEGLVEIGLIVTYNFIRPGSAIGHLN